MSEPTRPVALGYFRVHLLMTEAEQEIARQGLASFAETEGYALAGVYAERADTAPSAFEALVEALKRHNLSGVVVPSLRHLAVLGLSPTLSTYLERCTGARVLVADRGD